MRAQCTSPTKPPKRLHALPNITWEHVGWVGIVRRASVPLVNPRERLQFAEWGSEPPDLGTAPAPTWDTYILVSLRNSNQIPQDNANLVNKHTL